MILLQETKLKEKGSVCGFRVVFEHQQLTHVDCKEGRRHGKTRTTAGGEHWQGPRTEDIGKRETEGIETRGSDHGTESCEREGHTVRE